MYKPEDTYELKILDQFKIKVFPSPSTDGSFEILRVAAGNNLLSEWNNEPGTSAVALLRDFQSEKKSTAVTTVLRFCFRSTFSSLYSFYGFCNINFNHADAISHNSFMTTPYHEHFKSHVNY